MAGVEAYCVKCKKKQEMSDAKEVPMAKGRTAMQGTCPVCGTKMFRIMGKKK
jgi:Zn finger protein HypA/HybF involved in hydrogenase expression